MGQGYGFTISNPDALVASLPHMLGYQPQDSLVAVWVREGLVLVTQRVDLPRPLSAAFADSMFKTVEPHGPSQVLLVAVGKLPVRRMRAFAEQLAESVQVLDALVVTDGCWVSALSDPGEQGSVPTPLDVGVALQVDALFTLAGSAPASSRADLARDCVPGSRLLDAESLDEIGQEVAAALGLAAHRELVVQAASGPLPLDDEQVAWLGLAVHDIRVRDCVIWHLAGYEDISRLWEAYRRWCAAVTVLPGVAAVPAATLAGICAWLIGDGTRASLAAQVALQWNPDYSLAVLVDRTVRSGTPPALWRSVVRSLDYQVCVNGTSAPSSASTP